MAYSSSERERLKRELETWAAKTRERNLQRTLRKRALIEKSLIRAEQKDQVYANLRPEIQALQETLGKIPSRIETGSLDILDLPTRVTNALARNRIACFKDLKELGAVGFATLKNIGVNSILALQSEILDVIHKSSESSSEVTETATPGEAEGLRQVSGQATTHNLPPSLHQLWSDVLSATRATEGQTTPDLETIVARYGLRDGVRHTLEEVGQRLGVTRERIRQREENVVKRLRHPAFSAFRNAAHLVREYLGSWYVAPLSAVIGQETEGDVDLRGMARLVVRVSADELVVVADLWIAHASGLPPKLAGLLSQAADGLPAQIGWEAAAAISRDVLGAPGLPVEVAVGIAMIGFPAEVVFGSNGKPAAIRHRAVDLTEAAYVVLREAEGPLTLREMGERVLARFQKWSPGHIEAKVGTAIQDDSRFAQVERGTYDLSSRFPIATAEQRAILDVAREVLEAMGKPTDTSFLLRKVRQRIDMPKAVNRYSLFWMLRSDQRFLVLHRLHVGLQEWKVGAPSAPFAAALVSVLEEAKTPLTEREVYKRLLSTRSPQSYAVNQGLERLARQGRILKLAPQTYVALSALKVPSDVSEAIKAFTDEYAAEYGLPIVARFLRDALAQREPAASNLSDAHVDYVLGTDKRFARIGYGVFVPINMADVWLREPISAHATHLLEARGEPLPRAELLWILEEAHQLQGGRVWERLLRAHDVQLYPYGYIGLRKWAAQGWRKVLESAWDRVIAELQTTRRESPSWLTSEAAEALRDLARVKGEAWILERLELESLVQSRGLTEKATQAVSPSDQFQAGGN